jgi:hypothetical protein
MTSTRSVSTVALNLRFVVVFCVRIGVLLISGFINVRMLSYALNPTASSLA